MSDGVSVISFDPSKDIPLIFRAVFNFVAVAALPVKFPIIFPLTVKEPSIVPPYFKPNSITLPESSFVKIVLSFKFIANSPSANTEAAGR